MKINISISTKELVLDKEDLRFLKRDPHGFIDSLYTSDLIALIRGGQDSYHTHGQSQLTDAQYDFLKDELEKRKPNHPLLSKVGAMPKTRTKVKIPYPLFSLNKIKPGEKSFDSWVKTHKGPYVVSDKEDGLSIEVLYDKGIPDSAYTRGNGTIGQNVTHLIPHLEIPLKIPIKTKFVVRMEAAMAEEAFIKHFSKEKSTTTGKKYENARNLVAGVVNTLKKEHEALKHIHTISYEVIEPRMRPSLALTILKKYGFHIVPYRLFTKLDPEVLSKYLAQRKAKSPVGLDGLVIEQDKISKRPTAGNPDYAVAFKTGDEEVETKVLSVTWEETRYGTLNPVINIQPVRLEGVTVKQANAFNAKFIETGIRQKDLKLGLKAKPIGPGAIIKIKRSGGVIPHIIAVVKGAAKPSFPDIPFEWKGVNIQLAKDSNLVRDKRITSFFTTLGIDFIKQGMVEKFAEHGLNTVLKIIRATPEDFLEIEGIKERSAEKYYQAIQDKISKPIKLSTLMKASGQFSAGVGERRIDMILEKYPNILDIYDLKGEQAVKDKVIGIPGFQEKTADLFIKGIPGYLKWFRASKLKTKLADKIKTTSTSLKGQHVAFTGFRSKELEEQIRLNSGIVDNGVKTTTTILITDNPTGTTSKLEKARKQGISIMTPDLFTKKYKL
jgi:DNA ligase (NAD+)